MDIRSVPYSRFNSQYNRNRLIQKLSSRGIEYVYLGDELGGRPAEASCYTPSGKPDYEKIRQKQFFIVGIGRLSEMLRDGKLTAIMCSESDPGQCHRTTLVSPEMTRRGVEIVHIGKEGKRISGNNYPQLL